ncbi:hypothetical protein BGZ94_009591 [Podila epigama]|nr:hypothetical protein BGZ94_009591 [Podila epigama]
MSPLTYGYAMNDTPGDRRIITPPMLGPKISLSLGHTSTFVFLGTKAEILEWFHTIGATKTVQAALFYDRPIDDPLSPKVDLVFDLFPCPNPDITWIQYYQSLFKADPSLERFRVEIRPEQPKIDAELEPLYRTYAKNGVCLGDVVKVLEKRWAQPPQRSYVDVVKEMFMERDEAQDHAQEVALQQKRLDDEGREVDLEDIVVSVPLGVTAAH